MLQIILGAFPSVENLYSLSLGRKGSRKIFKYQNPNNRARISGVCETKQSLTVRIQAANLPFMYSLYSPLSNSKVPSFLPTMRSSAQTTDVEGTPRCVGTTPTSSTTFLTLSSPGDILLLIRLRLRFRVSPELGLIKLNNSRSPGYQHDNFYKVRNGQWERNGVFHTFWDRFKRRLLNRR